jgi:hypothetical protein
MKLYGFLGVYKYQLTIPLPKSIKKVVNTTLIPVK